MRPVFLFVKITLIALLVFSCSKKVSEKEYFDLATQYMDQQNWVQAEENFSKVIQEYPNGLFSSKALFMLGYINANHMDNFEKAKEYYTEFLEKYPDHELADAARYELENMGKDVEDLPFLNEQPEQGASEQSAQQPAAQPNTSATN